MQMNGDTLLLATVGDPVSKIRMPALMPKVFADRGDNAVWLTLHVTHENLATIPTMLRTVKNLRGVTITMPHKASIIPLLDKISLRAEIAGAVNMVRLETDGSLYGDNADGLGFVQGLANNGFTVQGCHAWVCGAGGVGSGIAAALCERGAQSVAIFDLDQIRAGELTARLAHAFPDVNISLSTAPRNDASEMMKKKTTTLAINASPIGSREEHPLPFNPAGLHPDCWVADVIMQPLETRLLKEAKQLGYRTQPGEAMLEPQIAMYLNFFGMNSKRVAQ